jgi:SAM-dependent methyltransferase
MRAYQGNLIDPSDPNPTAFDSPKFRDFDVAIVGLGFHHFDDPALAAKRLAERLRPGGVLVIADFYPHGHSDVKSPATHTVTHHGFSEEQIKVMFENAGVGKDFAMEELGSGIVFQGGGHAPMKRRVFLARGTKI